MSVKLNHLFLKKWMKARIHGQTDHYLGNAFYGALIVDTTNQNTFIYKCVYYFSLRLFMMKGMERKDNKNVTPITYSPRN